MLAKNGGLLHKSSFVQKKLFVPFFNIIVLLVVLVTKCPIFTNFKTPIIIVKTHDIQRTYQRFNNDVSSGRSQFSMEP